MLTWRNGKQVLYTIPLQKHQLELDYFASILLTLADVIWLQVLRGHDDHVITCLEFCGNRIVSGSDDNTLKVWDVDTGQVRFSVIYLS